MPFKDFLAHKADHWNQFFYLRKIRHFVRFKKAFRFRMLSDGIAVSLEYDVDANDDKKNTKKKKQPPPPPPPNRTELVQRFNRGEIPIELGIDPGDKTWLSIVRREHMQNKEVKLKKKKNPMNQIEKLIVV